MLRAQKTEIIDDLRGIFAHSGVIVVTRFGNMSVAEATELRGQVREAGASFRVVKNRLAKEAVAGTEFEIIRDFFTGPTAIAYSADPVAAPKVTTAYAKKNEKLEIMGGGLSGTILTPDQVKALADMPPIEEIRAKLLGVLVAPMSQLVGIMNAPAQKVVGVIGAPPAKLARVLQAKASQG